MELRRFRYLTDDPIKREEVDKLIEEKDLSRKDLYLLITGLGLNFDISHEFEKLFQ